MHFVPTKCLSENYMTFYMLTVPRPSTGHAQLNASYQGIQVNLEGLDFPGEKLPGGQRGER